MQAVETPLFTNEQNNHQTRFFLLKCLRTGEVPLLKPVG